jgi:hypothetical protein
MNAQDLNNVPAAGMWTIQDQSQLVISPYSGLVTATQSLSRAAVYAGMEQRRANIVASATSGPYCTVYDQAVFVVQSDNAASYLVVPGPIETIFKSDHYTVDLANGLVQAWWTQVKAMLGDPTGAPWTQLKRGYRRTVRNLGPA